MGLSIKKKIYYKLLSLCLLCVIVIMSCPSVEASSSISEKRLREIMSPYEEWRDTDWGIKDAGRLIYVCPKKDVSLDETLQCAIDVRNLVLKSTGRKKAIVGIEFNYSPSKFHNSDDEFDRYVWKCRDRYEQLFSYDGITCTCEVGSSASKTNDKWEEFTLETILYFWQDKPSNINKLHSIVNQGKAVVSTKEGLAKYFFEYIAENVDYDDEFYSPESDTYAPAHRALVYGKGVCGDMAIFYYDLCVAADIPVVYCYNRTALDHAWNQVYLDGRWYNVDVTGTIKSASGSYGWRYHSAKGQNVRREGRTWIDFDFSSKFTDPTDHPDGERELVKMQKEMLNPSVFLNAGNVLEISDATYDMKPHIRQLKKNAKISYKIENPSIATVSKDGVITPVKKGSTTLKIIVKQGGKTYQLKQKIKVS